MHKSDANAAAIVATLRKYGCSVEYIASPFGRAGVPDLLVGRKGITHLLEVKTPKRDPRGRQIDSDLSDSQINWHLAWRGKTVTIVTNSEEALQAVGVVL
jgi:Holliday junction resolvase